MNTKQKAGYPPKVVTRPKQNLMIQYSFSMSNLQGFTVFDVAIIALICGLMSVAGYLMGVLV